MSKDNFDPRFDAAFQPGFVAAPTAKATAKRSSSPAKAALESARETAREQAELAPAGSPPVDAESRRRVNPFLIGLLVLAVALIVLGIQAIRTIQSVFNPTTMVPDLDYNTIAMLAYAGPISIALGVAIGAGVLFMYAIAWQRRV